MTDADGVASALRQGNGEGRAHARAGPAPYGNALLRTPGEAHGAVPFAVTVNPYMGAPIAPGFTIGASSPGGSHVVPLTVILRPQGEDCAGHAQRRGGVGQEAVKHHPCRYVVARVPRDGISSSVVGGVIPDPDG